MILIKKNTFSYNKKMKWTVYSKSFLNDIFTNYRLSGVQALAEDEGIRLRAPGARLERVLIWREGPRIPALAVQAVPQQPGDLRLGAAPSLERHRVGAEELAAELCALAQNENGIRNGF